MFGIIGSHLYILIKGTGNTYGPKWRNHEEVQLRKWRDQFCKSEEINSAKIWRLLYGGSYYGLIENGHHNKNDIY